MSNASIDKYESTLANLGSLHEEYRRSMPLEVMSLWADEANLALDQAFQVISELVAARDYRAGAGSPYLSDVEKKALDRVVSIVEDLHIQPRKGRIEP